MYTHAKTELIFAAKGDDTVAVRALEFLKQEKQKTIVLTHGQKAPPGSIALYSHDYSGKDESFTYWTGNWPSKYFRTAGHLLVNERPEWTLLTPFLVCVRSYKSNDGLKSACRELVRSYQDWFEGRGGYLLPWESANNKHTNATEAMEDWLDLVSNCLGHDTLVEILESQMSSDHKGRGGFVVYYHLQKTGRVILDKRSVPESTEGNSIYKRLSGFDRPVVSYGTSDLANMFELLETLKLGYQLNLPIVFETYPGSHNWGRWRKDFLNPSLEIFGSSLQANGAGIPDSAKFTHIINPAGLAEVLVEAGLHKAASVLKELPDMPIYKIYHYFMESAAQKFLSCLGINTPFSLTTTEEMLETLGWMNRKALDFAQFVEKRAGHPVGAYNSPEKLIMSNEVIPDVTLKELHDTGWWLSGAPLYHMIYHLGNYGGIVVMVKDSTKGDVNLLAKPYLQDNGSQLFVTPVGLFRLSAETQNEDWSIDPLVFYELLHIWEKPQEQVRRIWDAMRVPLARKDIGSKVVMKVTGKGVYIK